MKPSSLSIILLSAVLLSAVQSVPVPRPVSHIAQAQTPTASPTKKQRKPLTKEKLRIATEQQRIRRAAIKAEKDPAPKKQTDVERKLRDKNRKRYVAGIKKLELENKKDLEYLGKYIEDNGQKRAEDDLDLYMKDMQAEDAEKKINPSDPVTPYVSPAQWTSISSLAKHEKENEKVKKEKMEDWRGRMDEVNIKMIRM
jgi:hypothetical protein